MNKNLITFGIAILLMSVGLSGCIKDPFEGTWTNGILEISYSPDVISIFITEITFTGGVTYLSINVGRSGIIKTIANGTYETEENNLYLHISTGVTFSFKYKFDFEDGKDVLYLDKAKFTKV